MVTLKYTLILLKGSASCEVLGGNGFTLTFHDTFDKDLSVSTKDLNLSDHRCQKIQFGISVLQ